MKNILLLCGGGSSEHEVSLVSAKYLEQQLNVTADFNVIKVEITPQAWLDSNGLKVELDIAHSSLKGKQIETIPIDYVVPCIHGFPGETGDIQSLLEMAGIPYLGCGPEASSNSFNKITSKLWYDALGIPNTPYRFLTENSEKSLSLALQAFDLWGAIFVKAARQGSSVGCYSVTERVAVKEAIHNAFQFSDQVLIEMSVKPRELEVAAYVLNDELKITKPGEVIAPEGVFYTYDEKYSSDSHSSTVLEAGNLSDNQLKQIEQYSRKVFTHMNLKNLSRIDFFLTDEGHLYLNEVNTFPGMTPISMFPKLMEYNGDKFHVFLEQTIRQSLS
ncbi:D-alanine--D-alanine ligase [Vibrio casei]|uniref:D-alanine--D-alanine ligase n=3 Tax=Vibrionaceae TaxID=641 RepID=A0A368LHK2_9VIBR|nr:D-alanine--D-alanine ligase [Vibrio casei]SJN25545.1 D-alanine--D-alanine ligase [Vibrio casei]HBV75998.1 D-alanine--D-alanine ligase [Vibrio sp.]